MVPLGQGNGRDTRVRVAVESRRDKEDRSFFMTRGEVLWLAIVATRRDPLVWPKAGGIWRSLGGGGLVTILVTRANTTAAPAPARNVL